MAAADLAKRPKSSYFLWLDDNRAKIVAKIGSAKGPDVSKQAGQMWKALSDAEKAPYEKKAQAAKDAHKKFLDTDAGKAAKAGLKGEAEAKKCGMKAEEHQAAVETASKIKKPASGYWMWLSENREDITKKAGSAKGSVVGKKAGEIWKAMKQSEKDPWEKKAAAAKAEYEKYAQTEEGKAALDAKKMLSKRKREQGKKKKGKRAKKDGEANADGDEDDDEEDEEGEDEE
eukprot:gnl/TRDRNA2_/TRDRNA2_170350_c0_seq10.p1 gnl/TRDRNA2_/TRDRNA2_170350_c0~~gnl/TRDRNA2_/TRDRNA2_170350_c0_seq10.p1  ORF type:complete len:230 (+),score=99.94 gnl/TRDRNA2_/TRDRNA2_170350_c0_seq10:78-767(+)